jgi:hypothetical protein
MSILDSRPTRFICLLNFITTTIGYFYEYLGRKTKINFYIGCAILITVKLKDESRRKFINMQCMWKAKDHRQTAQ